MNTRLVTLLLGSLILTVTVACTNSTPAPNAAVEQSDQVKVIATIQVPKGLFDSYSDPEGRFAILYPRGWQVSQQPTDNVLRVATLFQGPQGQVAVLQFDNGKPLSVPIGTVTDALLQKTGVRNQPGYKEIARTQMPDGSIQIEMVYQRTTDKKLAHAIAAAKADGSRVSLWTVTLDDNLWADSLQSVKAILSSYQAGAWESGQ